MYHRALLGEQMRITQPKYIGDRADINKVWKDGEWNSMRIRMIGEAPHITLWINGTNMREVETPKNDQIGGFYGGMIGLQLHWPRRTAGCRRTADGSSVAHAAVP